jgi:hypothetical protein
MSEATNPRQQALIDAATRLANSLIGRVSYSHSPICSSCHMGGYGDTELNHIPSCLVGQVLSAVRAMNPAEEEFFRVEGHSRLEPETAR